MENLLETHMGTLINLITQASSSQDGGTKLHPRNYRLGPIPAQYTAVSCI